MARKILLADDSVTAQNMGRKILADAGYEVIAVNNGSAALKKIAELKPDLVILDVYMPGYSGLEVCQRLKESQETARIPVLLSVGKLEPFKPEEAQRVRADGYIVKPFEASELLSALSKLEDKVVPRAEPSKPGRFARAIAAAEESSRGGGSPASEKSGWKSRISFPQEKAEPAEKIADDASIYNSVNRDLRTVVETAEEKAGEPATKQAEQAVAASEPSVDVAALASAGLPKDVTPEEVTAIAAATAQIQMAGDTPKNEHWSSESQIAEAENQANAVSSPPDVPAESGIESLAHETAAADTDDQRSSNLSQQDEPVTMAATAESVVAASPGASRWTAVPVALEGEEATLALDQEMQRACEAIPAKLLEAAVRPEAMEAQALPVAGSEAPTSSFEAAGPAPVEAEVARSEAKAEGSPMPEFAEPNSDPTRAEFMSPVSEAEVAGLAGLVGLGAEIQQPPPQEESAIEGGTSASSEAFVPIVQATEGVTDNASETKPDSEDVKSTAAAWASWRQIRDTSKDGERATSEVGEFAVPESAPEEAARAVAAGAEQIVRETSAEAARENPADVASIVDSVLADLRPKLMAEISRKMAEKK